MHKKGDPRCLWADPLHHAVPLSTGRSHRARSNQIWRNGKQWSLALAVLSLRHRTCQTREMVSSALDRKLLRNIEKGIISGTYGSRPRRRTTAVAQGQGQYGGNDMLHLRNTHTACTRAAKLLPFSSSNGDVPCIVWARPLGLEEDRPFHDHGDCSPAHRHATGWSHRHI